LAKQHDETFNDRMVKRTVLPVIYLWMAASGAVVAMGIWQPDIVLKNLDGFIALIAIIGGVAAPALATLLRMWEGEQTIEIAEHPIDHAHSRERDAAEHTHRMEVEKLDQKHQHTVEKTEKGVLRPRTYLIPEQDVEKAPEAPSDV
jgi:hypothetical protein